jgi:hypothetical protein
MQIKTPRVVDAHLAAFFLQSAQTEFDSIARSSEIEAEETRDMNEAERDRGFFWGIPNFERYRMAFQSIAATGLR